MPCRQEHTVTPCAVPRLTVIWEALTPFPWHLLTLLGCCWSQGHAPYPRFEMLLTGQTQLQNQNHPQNPLSLPLSFLYLSSPISLCISLLVSLLSLCLICLSLSISLTGGLGALSHLPQFLLLPLNLSSLSGKSHTVEPPLNGWWAGLFFFLSFNLFIHEREREVEIQAEGEAGSMQGAPRGTWSRVSRITPWVEGGAKPAEPPWPPMLSSFWCCSCFLF